MRLSAISVTGFGGIADRIEMDLDADVVILVGSNGYGKTTICNAIAWALSGRQPSDEGPRNVYASSGTTSVELTLEGENGQVTISRTLANPDENDTKKHAWVLTVQTSEQTLKGESAQHWLKLHVARTGADNDFDTAAAALVDVTYLRQESLRQFLTGQADTDRFTAIAEMIGAGTLQNFVNQLESNKTAWVRATNRADLALEPQRAHLDDLQNSLTALASEVLRTQSPQLMERWSTWVETASRAWSNAQEKPGKMELSEETLRWWRNALRAAASEAERRESLLRSVLAELRVEPPSMPDPLEVEALQTTAADVSMHASVVEHTLSELRRDLAQQEEEFQRNQSTREDLAAMASIVLRHLSDTCAACGQEVNEQAFALRLNGLVSSSEQSAELARLEKLRGDLSTAERLWRNLNRQESELTERLRIFEEQEASAFATQARRAARLADLSPINGREVSVDGLAPDVSYGVELIESELRMLQERQTQLMDAEQQGMEFEPAASIQGARARVLRTQSEMDQSQRALSEAEADIELRRSVGEDADRLVRQLKEDAESFVNTRISELEPLLAQFYAAIDPHPTFRSVQILIHQSQGKRRLSPVLHDEEHGVTVSDPGRTLSTSQANALAVALFLSFNLGFSTNALSTLVLDDPLQNLDDLHLLGLVDLLRKVAPHRQIIVTTHDHTFAALLARKLRPIGPRARTTFIQFTKWDRTGPGFHQMDIPKEENPLKLVVT